MTGAGKSSWIQHREGLDPEEKRALPILFVDSDTTRGIRGVYADVCHDFGSEWRTKQDALSRKDSLMRVLAQRWRSMFRDYSNVIVLTSEIEVARFSDNCVVAQPAFSTMVEYHNKRRASPDVFEHPALPPDVIQRHCELYMEVARSNHLELTLTVGEAVTLMKRDIRGNIRALLSSL
jgi:hypothetical protein